MDNIRIARSTIRKSVFRVQSGTRMPLTAGTRLGPYEIHSPIKAGGMGQVWKARDTRLDRIVAIKTSMAQFSDRFQREARAVAALIADVLEVRPKCRPCIVSMNPRSQERDLATRGANGKKKAGQPCPHSTAPNLHTDLHM
jgi:hypothetical protein